MRDLLGDIFDGCLDPLTVALLKLERVAAARPEDTDLQDSLKAVKRAADAFVGFRKRAKEATDPVDTGALVDYFCRFPGGAPAGFTQDGWFAMIHRVAKSSKTHAEAVEELEAAAYLANQVNSPDLSSR